MQQSKIAVVDFGSQYTHLLAAKIRALGVYSFIVNPAEFQPENYPSLQGIIFSGGPHSVTEANSPKILFNIFSLKIPILGICYGHQLLAKLLGGEVKQNQTREFGLAELNMIKTAKLLQNIPQVNFQVWMSHCDEVIKLPAGADVLAYTKFQTNSSIAAFSWQEKFFGVQFHPEVFHTQYGEQIIANFLETCRCTKTWNNPNIISNITMQIKNKVGSKKVLLFLSGGVDSLVCLGLCLQALSVSQLKIVHIDSGFMRKNESQIIKDELAKYNPALELEIISAENIFIDALQNTSDPEEKRKLIGKIFTDIAQEIMQNNHEETYLIQGTIYPDTIESGNTTYAQKIKTHHNRVPEIQTLLSQGKVIEPLAELYKDEVREIGKHLGLPANLLARHPFPGPGLAIRILCHAENNNNFQNNLTSQAKAVPSLGIKELSKTVNGFTSQFGIQAQVLPIKSVGVQGDCRSYLNPVLLSPLAPISSFTWTEITSLATQLINKFPFLNRVVYALEPINQELNLVPCMLNQTRITHLQDVDAIISAATNSLPGLWQLPIVALPLQNSEHKWCFVLHPISSTNAMTADFYPLDVNILKSINANLDKIPQTGNILIDVTSKPPATIEWE